MVSIDKEHLLSERRDNKASAEDVKLPKRAMLLRDIYKFTKLSLDAFCPFDSSAWLAKGQEILPIALTIFVTLSSLAALFAVVPAKREKMPYFPRKACTLSYYAYKLFSNKDISRSYFTH